MNIAFNILADIEISPKLVFGAVAVFIWVLGSVLSSKQKPKPEQYQRPSREAQELAEVRRRIREQQNARKPALTPRIEQKRQKKQQQLARQQKAREQQAREQQARIEALRAQQTRIQPPPLPTESIAATQEIGSEAPSVRRKQSETARNVRLMLQRGGIAEAFILSEVLGQPKGLQEI